MIRMFNKLPHFVYLKNEKYFINTDYRIFIDFERNMQEKNDKQVIYDTLSNFYPAFLKIINHGLLDEAIDKFIWFYFCGKSKEQLQNEQNNKDKISKKHEDRIYDYEYDSDLIFGAFWDKHIDLTNEHLHWWKFRALWKTFPHNCEFKRVMGYRVYNGKDKDLLELKELNKLPSTKFEINEKKRHDKIFDKLNNMTSQ